MAKYVDKYAFGSTNSDQAAYNRRILGDATGETRHWYEDWAYFASYGGSWFYRGGNRNDVTNAGLFHFYRTRGSLSVGIGFRVVILGS